jgi:hypothetical protein
MYWAEGNQPQRWQAEHDLSFRSRARELKTVHPNRNSAFLLNPKNAW